MEKSNHVMSLMSLWGILLVVLGHSGFEEPLVMLKLHGLNAWIYMFHMPLFFFISGYLYSYTNKDFLSINATQFLRKKFLRLMVPYISFGIILFIIKYLLSPLSSSNRDYSIQDFFFMFIAPRSSNSTMGYLWFIGTLFFMFVIITTMGAIKLNLKKVSNAVCVVIFFLVLSYLIPSKGWGIIFNLYMLVWLLPFFVIGILFQINEHVLGQYITGGWGICLMVFCLTILGAMFIEKCELKEFAFILHILFALTGIYFSLILCRTLLKSNTTIKYILPFGNITYTIYLMSFFGQNIAKTLVWNILHLEWYFLVPSMFLGGIVFPLIVYWVYTKITIFQNHLYFRLLIGV